MKLKFVKMHGCGNDYIFFDGFAEPLPAIEPHVRALANRNTGIGGDGVVLIEKSAQAHALMRMYNADGTEAEMCGNAIRCVGKYLFETGHIRERSMTIETISGIKHLELAVDGGRVCSVRVDMGRAILKASQIPVNLPGDAIVGREVRIAGQQYEITCVQMGNPHVIIFHEDIEHFDLASVGPIFETHALFPNRTNFEVVQILGRSHLKMRVWERGTGETLACGTGACAAGVAAVLMGYCDKRADITVDMPGGGLLINYTDDAVYMSADATIVFSGDVVLA